MGRFLRFFTVFFLLAGVHGPVFAQETPDIPPASTKPGSAPPNPYANIPDEFIKEAQNFGKRCAADNIMKQYYDCRCLAIKYLDLRIRNGKEYDGAFIQQSIEQECIDATEAAGSVYTNCKNDPLSAPGGISVERYCACVSNQYAKNFELYKPEPGSHAFIELGIQARMACNNPATIDLVHPKEAAPAPR